MKQARVIIILMLFTQAFFSQRAQANEYSAVNKKMLLIPDSLTETTVGIAGYVNLNFHVDIEKLRAIYIWLTKNIEYDIANLFAINFYETMEEKILYQDIPNNMVLQITFHMPGARHSSILHGICSTRRGAQDI